MVKSIFFSFIVLFLNGCISDNISYNSEVKLPALPTEDIVQEPDGLVVITSKECIINKAESFVGTKEIGDNADFTNPVLKNLLQASGWTKGSAWCSYIAKGILDDCGVPNTLTGWSPSSYNKKDVIFTDGEFKQSFLDEDIILLSLSYNKYANVKSRYKGIGHVGITYKITENKLYSYEGNTFQDNSTNDNEGQSFCKKIRPLTNKTHLTRWQKN